MDVTWPQDAGRKTNFKQGDSNVGHFVQTQYNMAILEYILINNLCRFRFTNTQKCENLPWCHSLGLMGGVETGFTLALADVCQIPDVQQYCGMHLSCTVDDKVDMFGGLQLRKK